jgi:hypothetical protein
MWVYRFWIEVLFLNEGMKELSCRIKIIVFWLGFTQIHIPCNKNEQNPHKGGKRRHTQ